MQYILLLIVVIASSCVGIAQKQYSVKTSGDSIFLFMAVSAFFGVLCFTAISGFKLDFTIDVFWHSIGFATAYIACFAGVVFALKYGPFALTNLALNYSLVIPVMYGLIFLGEEISVICVAGLLFLAISVFMVADNAAKRMLSFKWLMCAMAGFIGNGMCSVLQKNQQMAFNGRYKTEFMIMALVICFVIFALISLLRGEKIRAGLKKTLPYSAAAGISNGVVNYFVMILTALMPTAILFPSILAGGMLLSCFAAIVYYKETLTKRQLIGYFAGMVSILLLNL